MELSNITNLQLEANNLNSIALMFIKYFCCAIIPLSIIGHLLNFYVFTRPLLRSNPCGVYFLFASVFGFLNACYSLPMRLIQTNYSYMDPTVSSSVICKVIWFLIYSIRSTAFWLVVLACGDRYLCSSSSANTRSWSSVRVAVRAISLTILINFLVYIHVPIFFRIDIAPTTLKPVCYTTGPLGSYRAGLNYCNLIFFGLSPPLCMLVFGMLTLRRVNHRRQIQIAPVVNVHNTQRNQRQILRMLSVQVLVYSVTGLAFSIGLIITTAINSQSLNVFQMAQTNLVNAIVGVVSAAGPCLSFYLFTLSSRLFRKELKALFNKFIKHDNEPQAA